MRLSHRSCRAPSVAPADLTTAVWTTLLAALFLSSTAELVGAFLHRFDEPSQGLFGSHRIGEMTTIPSAPGRTEATCSTFLPVSPSSSAASSSRRYRGYREGVFEGCNDADPEQMNADRLVQSALTTSLRRVRALMDASASFQGEDHDNEDDILCRFIRSCASSVYSNPSTIDGAGLGLFVRRTVPAATVVGLYPVHVMGVTYLCRPEGPTLSVALDEEDWRYFSSLEEKGGGGREAPSYLLHLLGNRRGERDEDLGGTWEEEADDGGVTATSSPFVDVNPSRPRISGWEAHLINDGATVLANTEHGVLAYLRESAQMQNCVICPLGPSPLLAAVTTRCVGRGEELLTSYGIGFWLEVLTRGDDGEEERTERTDKVRERERDMAMDMLCWIRSANEAYRDVVDAVRVAFGDVD